MRECIRKMIDRVSPADDPALDLASETIRLARLAASCHLILAARPPAGTHDGPPEPVTPRGSSA